MNSSYTQTKTVWFGRMLRFSTYVLCIVVTVLNLVVSTSATNCLDRFVSEMTYDNLYLFTTH